MAVPVDIYVKDESPLPVPVVGAQVSVFDVGTHTLVASASTDLEGIAAFLLPGSVAPGTAYEVRFFKLGVNFHGLKRIEVIEPVGSQPNKFDHTGSDSNILPISGSPYLCRCTGVFVDFSGNPLTNKTLRIMSRGNTLEKTPKVWNDPSQMVAPDEMEVQTDSNGRISINLIRTAKYLVTWGGDDDRVWCIQVPDEDAVNLVDLIHPFPRVLTWDSTVAPGNAVSVPVGSTVEVPIDLRLTDYSEMLVGLEVYFDFINSDGTLVESTYDSNRGVFVFRGLSAGTVTLTPQIKTTALPTRWPVPSVEAPAITVTITP